MGDTYVSLKPKTITSQTKKQRLAGLPSRHSPWGGGGGVRCLKVKTGKWKPESQRQSLECPGSGKSHSSPGITVANHRGDIWDPHHAGQDTLSRSRCATAVSGAMTGNRDPTRLDLWERGKRSMQCHPLPQLHAHWHGAGITKV